ncbi:hypothetical protein M2454_003108 [Aequitasia blattaphilus]
MSQVNERELGWEDEITKDDDYVLLPEGEYDFLVESFERARHAGSDNLPACNKAIVKIRVDSPNGTAYINHNLFLHTKTEGMLSAFFSAIGQKKKGENLKMDWNKVPGSTGKAKIAPKTYKDNQYNEIKRFLPKEDKQYTPGAF